MKVLWFEVTTPAKYKDGGIVIGGWQDSLESIVRGISEIELYVVFESKEESAIKKIDGVTYIPIYLKYNWFERQKKKWSWTLYANKVKSAAIRVVNKVRPDLIHCFGSEWLWGLVAEETKIPCVIHIQGSIVPYMNAQFPPGYNEYTVAEAIPRKIFSIWKQRLWTQSWVENEKRVWKVVNNYMGRTDWDYALVKIMNPTASYFHVEEALRPSFFNGVKKWKISTESKIRLVSTGCTTFWKGPDMMLKTANILKKIGVDFEWIVCGRMDSTVKKVVERREKLSFCDCNIRFLGYIQPDDLVDLLCNSSIFVHTAYIENSPNSICEAQILGVPIVSTNVGGISTLIQNSGILVPANDPWQMAYAITELAANKEKCQALSGQGIRIANNRHAPANIKEQLLNCYSQIISNNTTL